jgi:hypothetical protein
MWCVWYVVISLGIFTLPDFLKKSKHVAIIGINKISEYQTHPVIDQTAFTDT